MGVVRLAGALRRPLERADQQVLLPVQPHGQRAVGAIIVARSPLAVGYRPARDGARARVARAHRSLHFWASSRSPRARLPPAAPPPYASTGTAACLLSRNSIVATGGSLWLQLVTKVTSKHAAAGPAEGGRGRSFTGERGGRGATQTTPTPAPAAPPALSATPIGPQSPIAQQKDRLFGSLYRPVGCLYRPYRVYCVEA